MFVDGSLELLLDLALGVVLRKFQLPPEMDVPGRYFSQCLGFLCL